MQVGRCYTEWGLAVTAAVILIGRPARLQVAYSEWLDDFFTAILASTGCSSINGANQSRNCMKLGQAVTQSKV